MTPSDAQDKYIGHTDVELSEEGVKQIKQMAPDYEYPEVDAVFSSPLKRCDKTAQLIFPDKEISMAYLVLNYSPLKLP